MGTLQSFRLSARIRNARRRWVFSRPRMIDPRHFLLWTRPQLDSAPRSTAHHSMAQPLYDWPIISSMGNLEVRIAESKSEIKAAQRLRYRVFHEEMSAISTVKMRRRKRDFDRYDDICDHILVVDREASNIWAPPVAVGTYRLLRGEVAALHGGYYASTEFDLTPMLDGNQPGTRFLELGRSCVLKSYRSKSMTVKLLWKGIMAYAARYSIDVMFGCGSLPGTDPEALTLPLSYLHHFHRAPEESRVCARPELYLEMNRMPMEDIDPKIAFRALPPLIRGYVGVGSYFGDGAVVDHQFGCTDVLGITPISQMPPHFLSRFGYRK